MTEEWAEFDLDPSQPLTGYVVLMKTPLSENPTDIEHVNAAYEFSMGTMAPDPGPPCIDNIVAPSPQAGENRSFSFLRYRRLWVG